VEEGRGVLVRRGNRGFFVWREKRGILCVRE
jgi:hypothetical protein